ncbi:MAG: hypothetical protein HYV07_16515 [Deltaproteobacteria bacterium]|nr:hypothetical protein [Deltaproteobacteria bacterium]
MKPEIACTVLLLLSLVACGASDPEPPPVTGTHAQCLGGGYVAFDAANFVPQQIRVGAVGQMVGKMKEGEASPFSATAAAAGFEAAEALYESSADLRAKVQGRTDDHFAEKPNVGQAIDGRIMEAFAMGKTATTALSVTISRQIVEKSLIGFFYFSVYHELALGQRAKWDEGFGYYGAPVDNGEANRLGLASVATKRDATNGTSLASDVFAGFVDGSCALAKALEETGLETIDLSTRADVAAAVSAIDAKLVAVLAYSVGHEAFEMKELAEGLSAGDPIDELWIKLAELDPYFRAIEPGMNGRGGESAARAERIRMAIDAAWSDPSGAALRAFPAQAVIDDLSAEFSIAVRG